MPIVISYDTFVAISLESATETPYKETGHDSTPSVADYGVAWGAGPQAFLPLSGDESLATAMNFADLPLPEMNQYPNKFQSFAQRAEGGLSLIVPPGLLGGGTDGASGFSIKDFVYSRYDSGIGVDAKFQCKSATVWIRVGDLMKRFVGVKVAQADFQVQKGQPMVVNLSCMAYGEEVISVQSFSAPSWWTRAVYGGDFALLRVGDDSIATSGMTMTNAVEGQNVDGVNFSINNKLDDDPHRLWQCPNPRRLYNRDREVTGSIDSDMMGTTEYSRFLAGTLSSMDIKVSRKIGMTTYASTMFMPSIRYDQSPGLHAGGQKDRIVKSQINFKALGGLSGVGGVTRTEEMRWD